jgi:hypothetical protein
MTSPSRVSPPPLPEERLDPLETPSDAARRVGLAYRSGFRAFVSACERTDPVEEGDRLRDLGFSLQERLKECSFTRYVSTLEQEVIPDPLCSAFFSNGPVDDLFLFLMNNWRLSVVEAEHDVYSLLLRLLRAGAMRGDRALCALLPSLAERVQHTARAVSLCLFLAGAASSCDTAREMLHSDQLATAFVARLRAEASKADSPPRRAVFLMVLSTLALRAGRCALPVLHFCLGVATGDPSFLDTLDFLRSCAQMPCWRPLLVEHVLSARLAHLPSAAPLVHTLVQGASVELVVRAYRAGTSLLDVVVAHCTPSLRETSPLLFAAWEATARRVRLLCEGEERAEGRASASAHTCPITLDACRDPVAASDGHVYERSAIVSHMIRNGVWSPLTREPIDYTLVPLFSTAKEED